MLEMTKKMGKMIEELEEKKEKMFTGKEEEK